MRKRPKPHDRKPKTCPWDSPRLLDVIEFFASFPGGEVQMDLREIRKVTGIPESGLRRHIDWAHRYGAIAVEKVYPGQIGGRLPNRYTSLIGPEEWREVGPEMVKRWQERAERQPVGKIKGGNAASVAPKVAVVNDWSDVR